MRPVRIRVEGFSAYRQAVEVDFSGVDFFSLSGPTGSGKSSLVDAMVFALFGRVPRLGGNAVAPAITAGVDRARVAFDFEVDDTVYTAVRMAQRTSSGGATVKEARLEEGARVLASGADEVTSAVEDLLRLRFDDFTRTVVLPQGDFARFLTATKSERQGLLRNLLGLDVYTTVRELAKTRAAIANERSDGSRRALESLEIADDLLTRAMARRDGLTTLADSITEGEKGLADLLAAVADARAHSDRLGDSVDRLGAIEAPADLEELDTLIADARSKLLEAEEAQQAAAERLTRAETEVAALPSAEQVSSWKKSWDRLAELDERLAGIGVEEAESITEAARSALDEGLARLDEVTTEIEETRSRHAAHTLRSSLETGGRCPVCEQEVAEIPQDAAPSGLAEIEREGSRLATMVEKLRGGAEEARTRLAQLEAGRLELKSQRDSIAAELGDAPADAGLPEIEAELERLSGELTAAKDDLATLTAAEKQGRSVLEDLADRSRQVSRQLTSAQLKVADLDPPVPESDDVIVQWKELVAWKDATLHRLGEERAAAVEAVEEAEKTATEARQGLVNVLEAHDIEAVEPYAVQVATALESARARVETYEKAADQAATLMNIIETASAEAAVANALAGHLKTNGFEQWLMAGALTDLVAGANELLGQLSAGGYSLHSDESGSFSIVDHRNADEMRSVSTLSGGETFLVSLALALSLAETLAAKGGSGLDAIILDEGFGTLDDESLDTVASVLEELTGRGLMVGVITHVKDLAARAPVRYEVRREPAGSVVRSVL
ncbi:MAG: AAA family ATPase [Acidimicrobiia bacterium]